MITSPFKSFVAPAVTFALILGGATSALAYSCQATFQEAQSLISEAESKMTPQTDSRIRALITKAKGLADAGLISHTEASERHHGPTGKYAHGDSVRMGRESAALAKEALFLLTGEPR